MININIDNLVRQITPPLKRQPARLAFLRALVCPLIALWTAFVQWRKYQRMLVNVYGCKIILEGFLRHKYNTRDIHIVSSGSTLPRIGLRAEGLNSMVLIGLRDETSRLCTALRAESSIATLDVDFVVFVPLNVDATAVRADIEAYKPHFAKYKMVVDYYLVDDNNNRVTDDEGNYIIITI